VYRGTCWEVGPIEYSQQFTTQGSTRKIEVRKVEWVEDSDTRLDSGASQRCLVFEGTVTRQAYLNVHDANLARHALGESVAINCGNCVLERSPSDGEWRNPRGRLVEDTRGCELHLAILKIMRDCALWTNHDGLQGARSAGAATHSSEHSCKQEKQDERLEQYHAGLHNAASLFTGLIAIFSEVVVITA
jgi:hypothetical protein